MKKIVLTLAVALMSISAVNAQFVLGGGLGIGGEIGDKTIKNMIAIDKENNNFNLDVAPKFGYMFLEGKMEAGLAINLGYSHETNFVVSDRGEVLKNHRDYDLNLSFNPYIRYFFLKKSFFSFGIQGDVNLGTYFNLADKYYAIDYVRTAEETAILNELAKEQIRQNKNANLNWSIYVKPVMMFDLSEHCYMDLSFDLLGIGINGNYEKTIVAEDKFESNDVSVGLAFNNTRSFVKLGFAYKL